MTGRQIECFLEAAKQLNFTKAAENLYLSQPAVSRYIHSLEQELGTELFIRKNNRKLLLSENGKTYFHMFLRFQKEFQDTTELLHSPKKTLRFGYNIGWNISSFLPSVLSRCREKYPDLTISIDCFEFRDLVYAVLHGKLDAILTLENYPEEHPYIERERITTIQKIIIYSEKLSPNAPIASPFDLRRYDFFIVDDPRIRQLHQSIINCCKPYHFVPKLKTVSNMETVIASVENCLGVAILDEWVQHINVPGIRYIELDSQNPVCLAWNTRSDTSAVQILKNELLSYFNTAGRNSP